MLWIGRRGGERNIKDDPEVRGLIEFLSSEVKEFVGETGLYRQDYFN